RAELDGDRRVEQAVIEPGQRRIGQDQRQDGGTHQDEAAGRLQLEELAQSVQRHVIPPNSKARVYSYRLSERLCPSPAPRERKEPSPQRWEGEGLIKNRAAAAPSPGSLSLATPRLRRGRLSPAMRERGVSESAPVGDTLAHPSPAIA